LSSPVEFVDEFVVEFGLPDRNSARRTSFNATG
jgi:hypothetical protein